MENSDEIKPPHTPMSSRKKKIIKAAEDAGLIVENLYWEPVGKGALFEAYSGGWTLITDKGITGGPNMQWVLDSIQRYKEEGKELY